MGDTSARILPEEEGTTIDDQTSFNKSLAQGTEQLHSLTLEPTSLTTPIRKVFQVTLPADPGSSPSIDVSTSSTKAESSRVDEEETLPQTDSDQTKEEKAETCAICLDQCTAAKKLDKCGHEFCTDCIDHYFQYIKPQCPCCFTIYGEIRGNQPETGEMTHITYPKRLPGFEKTSTGTIKITYMFPDGMQDDSHPNPGVAYEGTIREAYLPDNSEGQHVLKLLEKAFELRQVFTIGQSRTTGADNVVTWNDIHHKTHYAGGMENFGYPDETYLNRVQQELAAKGIV